MNEQKKQIPYHEPIKLSEYDKKTIQIRYDICLDSGQLSNGFWVQELEHEIKKKYKVEYCIATSSCTQALLLCLSQVNDHIQLPAFNWWSDLYVLDFLQKKRYWLDIDPETWLPIEEYVVPSLYLNTFGNVGQSHNPKSIYDSSHCLGAKFKDIGLATCISLAPTKLITAGEGGLILTNDELFATKVTELRNRCCRLPEINAILALQTLNYLDEIMKWKRFVRNYYEKHLPGQFQKIEYDSNHNTIGFLTHLAMPGHIDTRQYYVPISDYSKLPNTKHVYERMVCLPSHYDAPIKKITESILEVNGL